MLNGMKQNKIYLQHILDEINYLINESINLTYNDLIKNSTLERAFARSLEIIGEASKNISSNFKNIHKKIEWKKLVGLRDKIIHHYFVLIIILSGM